MKALMKYQGATGKRHIVREGGGAVCGLATPERLWGVFEVPDELLAAIPVCGSCEHAAQKKQAESVKECQPT